MKLALFLVSTLTLARGYNSQNNPDNMQFSHERRFSHTLSDLALSGQTELSGWSDGYWPTIARGTADMWQGPFELNKRTEAKKSSVDSYEEKMVALDKKLKEINDDIESVLKLTEEDVFLMADSERDRLAPSMKLDILAEDFNFALTKVELDRTRDIANFYKKAEKRYKEGRKKNDDKVVEQALKDMNSVNWNGICHGWAPATVKFKEPSKCTFPLKTQDKQKYDLNFAVSDVNAMLSLMQADYNVTTNYGTSGYRCNTTYKRDQKEEMRADDTYFDINPGSYHIILANKIGRDKIGIVQDVTTDGPVWNQGVVNYEAEIKAVTDEEIELMIDSGLVTDTEVAAGTVKQVLVTNKVKYINEIAPHVEQAGEPKEMFVTIPYTYLLEIDRNDRIIGGRWYGRSVNKHPDFVWDLNKADPFNQKANYLFGQAMKTLMDKSGL